jgi:hypothetical protein
LRANLISTTQISKSLIPFLIIVFYTLIGYFYL